jgi:competence protein ComEC
MAAVILLARATGNLRNSVSALAAAISLLVLIDPFQALDPGFILSVLATSGLIFLAPLLSRSLQRYLPEILAELCAVPCAATLMCTPYLIYLTGEVSLFSVLFNVAVSPLVAPITILGFLSLITLPISIISSLALGLAHFLAGWITTIALWSQVSPSLRLNLWFLLVIAVVLWFVKARFSLIFAGVFGALFFISLILPNFYFPGKNWRVVQCDVGQGDALVINLGSGSGILFDAGPEPELMTKCLKRIGIKRLPLVVISHGHADHYYGAQGLSKKFEIGEMWSNGNIGIPEISELATRTVHRGMRANISDVSLEVLWPTSATQSFSTLQGDGSAENNKSVVILVRWSGVRILVTGDIEPEVQSILARDFELSDIEVLKVPHHGSRFQDSNFLREVSPSIALISVGRGNSYGHPDAETLEKLRSQGAAVFRTDLSGPVSVAWRFDDSAARYIFTTRVMRKEWWRLQWH